MSTTALERRARTRAQGSRLLQKILAEHEITQKDVAECCGVSHQKVQRWTNPEDPQTPCLADVIAMPRPIALGLLRWLSDAHGHLLAAAPEEASPATDLEQLAATIRECGEAASSFATSIADGIITPAEAREIDRQATEAIEQVAAMRERARALLTVVPFSGRHVEAG